MVRRVLIDCPEETPCNPCQYACPGQACFIIDEEFSAYEVSIDIPYEYIPLPSIGDKVAAVNNNGEIICSDRVIRVNTNLKNNNTTIVRLAVSKDKVREVRGML